MYKDRQFEIIINDKSHEIVMNKKTYTVNSS